MARLSCSALFALFSSVLEMIAMNLDDQVTTASIENEFPHWKVWTGTDQLLHACVPWDTNMYVTAETLAGLRDGIIGCLRLREFAHDQLKKTGTVSPPCSWASNMTSGFRRHARLWQRTARTLTSCADSFAC